MKAVILAGGIGTRSSDETTNQSKPTIGIRNSMPKPDRSLISG